MDKINESNQEKEPVKLEQVDLSSIIIAAVLGFVFVAIFIILRSRRTVRRDFILTGLCESGKTAIFMQMLHNKFGDTFTSMIDNVGEYSSGRMSGRLVDIPGHNRVRQKFFDQYKKSTKGLIFVVDSVTVQKEIRDVADALFNILSDGAITPCSILVLCNKQDQTTAKSAQIVRSLLEKEINLVRDSRSRKLQSTSEDEAAKTAIFVGKEGKDFEFTHLQQNVQFFECSAKENELSNLSDWIDRML